MRPTLVTLRRLVLATALVATATVVAVATGGATSARAAGSVSVVPVCGAVPVGHARCFSLKVVGSEVPNDGTAPSGYGPPDLQSAYKLPSAKKGAGQTVAIVDAFDDPTAESDLAQYRSFYGLPPCTTANGCFRKVDQNGGTLYPAPNPDWDLEISLDLDMVSAVCPKCHILLVEATTNLDTDLYTAEDTAASLGANTISNSWGGDESSDEATNDVHFNHPGIAITASSGDSGYGVSYPAASPFLTAVGGTSLTKAPSTKRGWAETAWDGAGSGCSAYESKPAWQTDSGCANRTVADVSAVADPSTGVAILYSGVWIEIGGTSVSSPIIASVYALAGNAASVTYGSYPYAHTRRLNDVKSGSNGTCSPAYLCTAVRGYDGPTGLGTPKGVGAF
jgi:subtilase family serine protease